MNISVDNMQASDDWKFLSKVVDRILLYLYITVCFVGGTAVMMSAPSLYDTDKPIDAGSSHSIQSQLAAADAGSAADCPQCQMAPA